MCARRHLGEILSAFEFLDRAALQMTLQQLPNIQNPLPESDVSAALNPKQLRSIPRSQWVVRNPLLDPPRTRTVQMPAVPG
jgi:hypothetical protein